MKDVVKYGDSETETLRNAFYIVGGTVPSRAPCYVVRRADAELYNGIRQGQFCYVLTARQMGKSSLINRVASQLRAEAVTVAQIDLTSIGHNLTIEQWYDGLLYEMGRELGLKAALRDCWRMHSDLGPLHRFLTVLREGVLRQCSGSVVIFIDEIEVVRSLSFSTDEFFAAIRECYNRRASDPDLKRLTFCLVGMASPAELIQDAQITPFNIGTQIDLDDFTIEEAALLAEGLAPKEEGGRIKDERRSPFLSHPSPFLSHPSPFILLKRIYYWTNGHPYLTQRLCHAVALDAGVRSAADVDRICTGLFLSNRAREIDTNLVPIRQYLLHDTENAVGLLDLYGKVRAGKSIVDDRTSPQFSQLRLSGVVRVMQGHLHVRNRIYEQVFSPTWIESNMPHAELRRQKVALKRGMRRSAAVFVPLLTMLSVLALGVAILAHTALLQKRTVQMQDREIHRLLHSTYSADIYQAQQLLKQHNVSEALELLGVLRNDKVHGFEWRYLWRECHRELFRLNDPTGLVYAVAFSPDGRYLATGNKHGIVRILNAKTGLEERNLGGDGPATLSVAFSPDGKSLAVGNEQSEMRLWNWQSGRPSGFFAAQAPALSVAIAGDVHRFAVVDESGSTVRIHDMRSPSRVLPGIACGRAVTSVALSPDGLWLATGDRDGAATVWEVATGKIRRRFRGQTAPLETLAFSPDGRRLASGSDDGTARVWDVVTGTSLGQFRGHEMSVTSVAISSDGRELATGGDDDTARVWDIATRTPLKIFDGHTGTIGAVAFSPDGRRLATGSFDGTARIWDLAPQKDTLPLKLCRDSQWRGAFSPGGERLAVRCLNDPQNPVQIWDTTQGRQIATLTDPDHLVGTMAFSWDGKRLVIGRSGRNLGVYDALTGRELAGDPASSLAIHYPLALSPDGRWLAAGDDATAQIWDLRRGVMVRTLKGHIGTVMAAAFSPDSTRLATASADHTARIWDLNGPAAPEILRGQSRALQTVAFSPDGETLVTGGYGEMLKLWSVTTGRETMTLNDPGEEIRAASFSSDGTLLMSLNSSGVIRLRRAATEMEATPSIGLARSP